MGVRYHYDGKLIVCNNTILRSAIRALKPVFDVIQGPSLFCSPYPRLLYQGRPLPRGKHDTIRVSVTALLHDTLAMCAVCKATVSEMGQTKMWVPDVIHKMLPDCKDKSEIAVGRKFLFMADGVHFTEQCYAAVKKTGIMIARSMKTMKTICIRLLLILMYLCYRISTLSLQIR
jgi:hypothetical protein